MQQLAAGQLGALGELYDRYHAPLRNFIARATQDAHDVDDLVHVTFLTAAQSAQQYDGRDCCRPWLIGIAAQLLRRRRQTLGRFLSVLHALRERLQFRPPVQASFELSRDLERALAGLSEAKRTTLLLTEVHGLTCSEVAEALAIPIGTVWTRLHAARCELRQALDSQERAKS
jgi:RNA polymerase sigma-70 factor (ECF subfamily)